jgi:hypothetical protein
MKPLKSSYISPVHFTGPHPLSRLSTNDFPYISRPVFSSVGYLVLHGAASDRGGVRVSNGRWHQRSPCRIRWCASATYYLVEAGARDSSSYICTSLKQGTDTLPTGPWRPWSMRSLACQHVIACFFDVVSILHLSIIKVFVHVTIRLQLQVC